MIYKGKEIEALTNEELTEAISKVALQREAFVERVANAPAKKRAIVPSTPGESFLAMEAALNAEKAKRGL